LVAGAHPERRQALILYRPVYLFNDDSHSYLRDTIDPYNPRSAEQDEGSVRVVTSSPVGQISIGW